MARIRMILLIIILIFIIQSCSNNEPDYTGEYPELYSIAINSLLGATGYAFSERKYSPKIRVIEEDAYGRKLFLYFENKRVSTFSLVISQNSDDKHVYYYPDYNFISTSNGGARDPDLIATSEKDFPAEEIEDLKIENDWNKVLRLDKCIKTKIVREKEKGPVKKRAIEELYNKALGQDAHRAKYYVNYLITDNYGRSIYLGAGNVSSNRFVVMLFQPDSSYDESKCLLELSDTQKYQDELKAFKELNDWNQPIPAE